MQIKQFRYGADNLGYLVYGDKTAMAVDGGAPKKILSFVKDRNLALQYVTNTHSHMDHTTGNRQLLSGTNAAFLDFDTLIDQKEIQMEGQLIRVLHTPGHTKDSVCFYFDSILISGDTLFNGKVGRCFTGDHQRFLQSIKTLLQLPGDTAVYAGHDYVEEYVALARSLEPDNAHLAGYDPDHVRATLNEERRVDPFLRFNDEKITAILRARGLPAETEAQRWESLMSLM
ncbi:hydroxyacylglutathione hydrolase [Desulfosalsimonas propionicica]|uniref:Hydroxyacylglutathione hydrolase n=1 Tax=Desulfosalsimonas propionicica TaxID=332175 RepID=A0A7W0C6Y5_9BACT|nr:hydroxyacylglutathione hydrolase family protein [Desulfosalsimonas propionicica]MBA2880316.1 hydroxyacylglutathione hydrolase [Desulfosalsimonas propionicica]